MSIKEKVDALLKQMTLEEKIGQLNQYNGSWDLTGPVPTGDAEQEKFEQIKRGLVGSMLNVLTVEATREAQELAVENSRLGIPLIFAYDVIHGYKTMFPVPLGETASWDLDAMEHSARVAAIETSAAGLHWTFAPMIDIGRDARWGRVMEGAGEDTYLCTQAALARVRGFQGEDLSDEKSIAACAKHFAAYGFAEAGRDYNTVDVSRHTLHNVILPPFKACATAGVATVMNAFNEIGGVPATGSSYLQRDLLKGEWNFQGFVVSDWGSISELISHGVAADAADAARIALNAGSDMDMESHAYIEELATLVESGAVKEADIDDAVRRILSIKFQLGLFDNPYKNCNPEREAKELLCAEHLAIARDVAKKSIVLLKNEGNLLPLPKEGKRIALIGPLAADKDVPLGSWRAQAVPNSAVSLLEGIQNKMKEEEVQQNIGYAKGCNIALGHRSFTTELQIDHTDKSGFPEAIELAQKSDIVVLAIGEDCFQSGEGRSQVSIDLVGVQEDLLKEIYKVNQNVVIVLMNGRPLAINWAVEKVPTIVEAWHLGSEAGNAIADVLFGDYNPSGKLPMTFPRHGGQVPIYYNHKKTGRPDPTEVVFWSHYIDAPNSPLYPFGYGLSYTTFEYSNLQLSTTEMSQTETMTVSVQLTNTGGRAGEEVVQLYIRDLVGSVTRPVKELKGFEKIMLEAGASQTVSFALSAEDLAFYGADLKFKAEPGAFKVFVGGNSVDLLEADFKLK